MNSFPKPGSYSAVVASVGAPRPKPAPKLGAVGVAAPVVQGGAVQLTPKAAAAIVAGLGPDAPIEQVLAALLPAVAPADVQRVCTVLRLIMRAAGTPLPDVPPPPAPPGRHYKPRSVADSMRLKKP